ncbi:MAG: EamA family transporter RarD [Rubrivivax sp.]|nr:EamA family transporter RarD [Rubrivivax sp.]
MPDARCPRHRCTHNAPVPPTAPAPASPHTAGVLYALAAFTLWGLMPLYFRQVASVPPLELILHRSLWALAFVLGLLAALGQWGWLAALRAPPRQLGLYLAGALLLAGNWLVYVLAIHAGRVVEASLGYFINPLVNVLLGVAVLHERLRRAQWLAVALATLGVLWLTWRGDRLPWMALTLAFSFGFYGLLRKTSRLGPLEGLALETLLLAPVMLPALAWLTFSGGGGAALRGDAGLVGWLVLAGPLSAIPLVLFAAAARRMPLALVGLMQYLSPTIQLVLGIWVFGEPFDGVRLVGFAFIWAALVLVSIDALWRSGLLPTWPRRASGSGGGGIPSKP